MAIRGITFSKQSVSPNDDSHIYKTLLGGRNGKTKGCNMTTSGDLIYISEGYFFASNRLIEIPSTETIETSVVLSGTTYFRLVFEIDLSKTNTASEFNQGAFKVLSSTTGYPDIKQEDLDDGGTIYQLPFAKFAKTVSGFTSFESELQTIGFVEDNTTIHVSKSGNDASGDGTETRPFASIQHAIDCIPKDLSGKTITINIASGTYSEDVEISGFSGGSLRFTFSTVTVGSISIYESNVIFTGTQLTFAANGKTYGLYVHRSSNVICQLALIINGATNGLFVGYGSRFAGRNTITINSCTYAATASYAAQLYVITLEGSKNNNGVMASAGIASIGSINAAMASTLYVTAAGGRIYTGAQASVPSY